MTTRARPWALSLCLLACSDEASDTIRPPDAGDAEPDAAPPQEDAGEADAGPQCSEANLSVAAGTTQSFQATALAWNGTGYGAVWAVSFDEGPDLYFGLLDATGVMVGEPQRITEAPGLSLAPSIVWTGSEYGVVWNDQRDNAMASGDAEIYFARVGADGVKIGDDLRVTDAAGQSYRPAIAWDGAAYAVSWNDGRDADQEIYFTRISAAGAEIGDDVRVTNMAGGSLFSRLAASSNRYALVWNDDVGGTLGAHFALLDESGSPVVPPGLVSDLEGASYTASAVWTGSEFGISWTQEVNAAADDAEIYFARFDASGAKVGDSLRLRDAAGNADMATLAFGDGAYGVAWRDLRDDAAAGEIYFTRITDGAASTALNVSMDASDSSSPTVTWDGSSFGVGWHANDAMMMNGELWFTRICP